MLHIAGIISKAAAARLDARLPSRFWKAAGLSLELDDGDCVAILAEETPRVMETEGPDNLIAGRDGNSLTILPAHAAPGGVMKNDTVLYISIDRSRWEE